MRVIYTGHSGERLIDRGISKREVREALERATTAYPTPQGSTCIVGSTATGRVLKVWVVGNVTLPIGDQKLVIKSVAGKDEPDA